MNYLKKSVDVSFNANISSLFKDDFELSKIFHKEKNFIKEKNDKKSPVKNLSPELDLTGNNNKINLKKEKEDNLIQKSVSHLPLSNARRRIENKKNKDKFKERKKQDIRTIFVGNVPLDASKKDLFVKFKKCGKISSIRFRSAPISSLKMPKKALVIKKDFHPKGQSLNAYVVFEEQESLTQALSLNNSQIGENHIRVTPALQKQLNSGNSVFVGNLSYDANEEKLRQMFEECGEVDGVRVVRDKFTRVGKGFAYISFKDKNSVKKAIDLNGKEFQKRNLRIQKVSSKDKEKINKKENKNKFEKNYKKFKKDESFSNKKNNKKNLNPNQKKKKMQERKVTFIQKKSNLVEKKKKAKKIKNKIKLEKKKKNN